MAWTNPRTWTDGELVTAAIMNPHVRDNLNYLYGTSVRIRKTADETVTSSTTLQNDDHFSFSIAANEVWVIDMVLFFTDSNSTNGIKWQWSVPSGATGTWSALTENPADSALTVNRPQALTVAMTYGQALTSDSIATIHTTIVNSTNAGTVNFQWAQNASGATNTIIRANSYMLAYRI